MGHGCSQIKPKLLEDLTNNTYFTGDEIREWYKSFTADCPTEHMQIEQFKVLYRHVFPYGDADEFTKHVFRTFDTNCDGTINFRELMYSLSVMVRGQPEEKMKWIFSMCDLDGNGYISRREMEIIISALMKTADPEMDIDETPKTLTQKIFFVMDENDDGWISFQEFMEAAKDPAIINFLSTKTKSQ